VHRGNRGAVLWAGFNAYFKSMHFDLPKAASPWHRLIDTALPAGEDLPKEPEPWSPDGVPLEARSLVVMVAREFANSLRL
jgi:glycogen operon protein